MRYIRESLYREYFETERILGASFEGARHFDLLCDLYCLGRAERQGLYEEARKEIVREVKNVGEYARYRRIREYEEAQGRPALADEETETLISVKGEALKRVEKYRLEIDEDATDAQIAVKLENQAFRGNVVALRILGIAECAGLPGYEGKAEKGRAKLLKAARWNDLTAALALLRYDPTHLAEHAKLLAALLRHTPYDALARRVEARYGVSLKEPSPEVMVVKKAIANGKVDPLHYDASAARIAFSRVLGIADKKKVLYAGNPTLFAEVCELPIGLCAEPLRVEEGAFEKVPIDLSSVKDAILNNLANADLRATSLYPTLLIATDSDYVARTTASLIGELFPSAKVIKPDVKAVKARDLVRTKGNLFVRDLDPSRQNVCLFVIEEEPDEGVLDEISDFLSGERRSSFRLDTPSLSLDLSSVLPICICSHELVARFAEETEVVSLPEIGREESANMVDALFSERKRAFGLEQLSITPEAARLIATMPIDRAESVIDKTIRACRAKGDEKVVSEGAVRRSMKGVRVRTYGFGGIYDED